MWEKKGLFDPLMIPLATSLIYKSKCPGGDESTVGAFSLFPGGSGSNPVRTGQVKILDTLYFGEGVVGHFDAEG